MAEIVNLRRARKQQARREAEAQAAANRAKFGEGKTARIERRAETVRAAAELDGKKRDA